MEPVSLEAARQALRHHRPKKTLIEGVVKKAAVAAVLRQESELELLFIRRAEHPHDPWSGHMAFPGGRVDPTDKDPLQAAHREAQEEIALDLNAHAQLVTELSHVHAMAHGKPLPMVIVPFVFELVGRPELAPDQKEVQETVWVPVSFLMDDRNRQTMKRKYGGVPFTLPCYRYEGRQIWGLTLKMADELLTILKHRSPK